MQINFSDFGHVSALITTLFVLFEFGKHIGKGRDSAIKIRLAEAERKQSAAEERERKAHADTEKELVRSTGVIAELERSHAEAMAELEKLHALAVADLEEQIRGLEQSLTWHRAQGGAGPGVVDFR